MLAERCELARMGDGGEDEVENRLRLGRALKTVARDVLLLVYHDRYVLAYAVSYNCLITGPNL